MEVLAGSGWSFLLGLEKLPLAFRWPLGLFVPPQGLLSVGIWVLISVLD